MNTPQLKLKTDAQLIATSIPTSRILEIELSAPPARKGSESTPLNLALVIDRSGSMAEGKLEQAKAAVSQILELMRPADSAAIVDYDDQVNVTAESSSITAAARAEMMHAVNMLRPRGSTDLGSGWLQGCECVARHQAAGKVNRTLLLTDGLANQGMTDPQELSQHTSALFERGITTSTFGIGEQFNEYLLEAMANHGGGNYYYISSSERIPELLMEEFKDLAAVTLKGVVLEVNFPAHTAVELFGDWRMEKQEHKLIVNLSDIAANRTVNLFLKILTPPGSGQLVMNVMVSGQDEENRPFQKAGDVTLQYASPDKVAQAETNRDGDMVTRFSSVAVGQYSNEAYKLERQGKYDEAGKLMDRLMAEHGASLPIPTRERYERIRREVREGLEESQRKAYSMDSYQLKRHRHTDQKRETDQE